MQNNIKNRTNKNDYCKISHSTFKIMQEQNLSRHLFIKYDKYAKYFQIGSKMPSYYTDNKIVQDLNSASSLSHYHKPLLIPSFGVLTPWDDVESNYNILNMKSRKTK